MKGFEGVMKFELNPENYRNPVQLLENNSDFLVMMWAIEVYSEFLRENQRAGH